MASRTGKEFAALEVLTAANLNKLSEGWIGYEPLMAAAPGQVAQDGAAGSANSPFAIALTQGDSRREATEADMVARMVPLAEVDRLIADGGITCAVTIAALGIVRARGLLGETR